MATFNVSFTLEAATLDEAQAAVATWVVSPGTTLLSIYGTIYSEGLPVDVPDGGSVGDALDAAAAVDLEAPADG